MQYFYRTQGDLCLTCRTDPNAQDENGLTLFHIILWRGLKPFETLECLVLLLNKSSLDPNITDSNNETALARFVRLDRDGGHPKIADKTFYTQLIDLIGLNLRDSECYFIDEELFNDLKRIVHNNLRLYR